MNATDPSKFLVVISKRIVIVVRIVIAVVVVKFVATLPCPALDEGTLLGTPNRDPHEYSRKFLRNIPTARLLTFIFLPYSWGSLLTGSHSSPFTGQMLQQSLRMVANPSLMREMTRPVDRCSMVRCLQKLKALFEKVA